MANKQAELEQRRKELAGLEEDLRGMQEGANPSIRDLGDDRLVEPKEAAVQDLRMRIEQLKSQISRLESSSIDGEAS